MAVTSEQLETIQPTDEEQQKQLVLVEKGHRPTPQEVSRFINDESGLIEDAFKCMLRGISNTKLNMVRGGTNTPSVLAPIEEENEDDDVSDNANDLVLSDSGTTTDMNTIAKLVEKLNYFIDAMCSIDSTDAKDMYSIIVLYEKMIFDLKSEISSLSNSLEIYETILGEKH